MSTPMNSHVMLYRRQYHNKGCKYKRHTFMHLCHNFQFLNPKFATTFKAAQYCYVVLYAMLCSICSVCVCVCVCVCACVCVPSQCTI